MAECLQGEEKCFEMGKGCYVFNFHGCCDGGGGAGDGCTCDPERLDRIEQGLQDLRDKLAELEEKVENCDCCDCEENPDDPSKPGPGIINVVREGRLIHSWPAGSDASVAIYSKDYAQAGDTIYIGEGTFECKTLLTQESDGSVGYCHLFPDGVDVIGVPGKTTVIIRQDLIAPSFRDNSGIFTWQRNTPPTCRNSTIKNVIYDYRMAPKTGNYSNALFTRSENLEVNNCVLKCTGGNNISLAYYNGGSTNAKIKHCAIFAEGMPPVSSYSGIGSTELENCVYSKDIGLLADTATATSCESNRRIDPATFRITTGSGADDPGLNAGCGVYSGPDAWPWP